MSPTKNKSKFGPQDETDTLDNLDGPKTYFHNSYFARKHVEIQNERLGAMGILKRKENLFGGIDLQKSPKKMQKFDVILFEKKF
jgi:hypothetical protein